VKLSLFVVLSLFTTTNAWAQSQPASLPRVLSFLSPAENVPQTRAERFHDYLLATVGPFACVAEAAGAGIQQWRDSPHEWGQGGEGFGKRLGNNMAYNAIHQTITYGLSEALHEDNRYFKSKKQGFGGRLLYALESPAMAYKNGRRTVSISSLSGIAGAAGISQAWAPHSWRGADNAAANFGLTYAGIAGLNVAREFVPDLIKKLRR
jgi:hypothetical protein